MPTPTVVILGAGAAGLAAARLLHRHGLRAVLVEARQRPGGRVDTRVDPLLGIVRERGAEFVHGRPPRVLALAREARLRLLPVPAVHRRIGSAGLVDAGKALSRGQALFQAARDDESVAALLARLRRSGRAGAADVALARAFAEGFYLADPQTSSAAAVARMDRALETIGADRTYRAEGGWSAVLAPLVHDARRRDALRLGVRAERVRWRPGAVEVEVTGPAGGRIAPIRGDRLVSTLPIGVLRAGSVRFDPAPAAAARAWRRLEMGPVVKVLLRFRRVLWSERGPRRLAFLHLPAAPVPVFWTPAPQRGPSLVGWAGGPGALTLAALGRAGALRAALRGLAPALALDPGALEDCLDGAELVDWSSDPLSGGGYAVFPTGSRGAPEELAHPVAGTLYFAGEATEPDFAGTVDGALRSGERAARQILESF